MRIFAQRPNASQHTPTVRSRPTSRTHPGQHYDANTILNLQGTVGNQAVQVLLKTDPDSVESDPGATATALRTLDFGRIPVPSSMRAVVQSRLLEGPLSDVAPAMRSVHEHVAALPSSGAVLDGDVQARYERALGTSLGDVRIHTDARAAAFAEALNAEAYTIGRDIVFGTGRYQPGSPAGQRLLAHELAHAAQERSSTSTEAPLTVSQPGDRAEREADRAADVLLAGRATRLATGLEPPFIARPGSPGALTASSPTRGWSCAGSAVASSTS
jgi:hypothetical protein